MLSAIWLLGNRQQAMGNCQLELATGCYLLSPGAVYNFRHCELKSARNRTVTVPRHCVFLLHLNMITNYGQATVQQCSSAEERAQCGAFNTHVVACVQCDSATYGREQATQAVWLFFMIIMIYECPLFSRAQPVPIVHWQTDSPNMAKRTVRELCKI